MAFCHISTFISYLQVPVFFIKLTHFLHFSLPFTRVHSNRQAGRCIRSSGACAPGCPDLLRPTQALAFPRPWGPCPGGTHHHRHSPHSCSSLSLLLPQPYLTAVPNLRSSLLLWGQFLSDTQLVPLCCSLGSVQLNLGPNTSPATTSAFSSPLLLMLERCTSY